MAGDVGAVQLDQARGGATGVLCRVPAQHRAQGSLGRRAKVAGQDGHHRLPRLGRLGRLVVLQAHHGVAATGLEGLHPPATLLAHPQGHVGVRQGTLGGVEVGCPQTQGRMVAAIQAVSSACTALSARAGIWNFSSISRMVGIVLRFAGSA